MERDVTCDAGAEGRVDGFASVGAGPARVEPLGFIRGINPMRHCVFCNGPLGEGIPDAPAPGRRHAYDPHLGRLWEICGRCHRWSAVPMALRWETLEGWEAAVRDRGRTLLETGQLALLRVDDGEVVRVGRPPLPEWGGWRYGERLPDPVTARRGFLARIFGSLPTGPLEGYDPYGLGGPMGGVSGSGGPSQWLASPFIEQASTLTLAFASIPFVPECPSCAVPLPLNPWEFQEVTFRLSREVPADVASASGAGGARDGIGRSGLEADRGGRGIGGAGLGADRGGRGIGGAGLGADRGGRGIGGAGLGIDGGGRGIGGAKLGVGVEVRCAHCSDRVLVPLDRARPALRMGLGIVDAGRAARKVGEEAGIGLERVGGGPELLAGLGRIGAPLGELELTERVALAMALDAEAEAEALEREWREAEEIAAIMDGELTHVEGFLEFRERLLGGGM